MKSLVTKFLAVAALVALAATAQAQVQTFDTKAGPVKITPIFHATARIEAGGKVIYIDPCKPTNFAGHAPSRPHPDHPRARRSR